MSTRTIERPLQRAEAKAESGTGWYTGLARVGLVAKGFSYGIVGLLALKLAIGEGGQATSRQGALRQLAGTTYGTVLLILLAFGFAAYAIWRFLQTTQTDKWGKRAGYVGRGLVYSALAFSTV